MPRLKFNSSIYKEEAVKKAISAFGHLAKFSIKRESGYFKVNASLLGPDFEDVFADEFGNYVLAETKGCVQV